MIAVATRLFVMDWMLTGVCGVNGWPVSMLATPKPRDQTGMPGQTMAMAAPGIARDWSSRRTKRSMRSSITGRPGGLDKRPDLPHILPAVRLHAARYVDGPGMNRGDRPRD